MTEDTINNLEMLGSGDSMEIEEVKSQIVPVSKKTSYKPRPDRREKVRELMRQRRMRMTPEEKEIEKLKNKLRVQERRSQMSEAEKEQFRKRDRERKKRRKAEQSGLAFPFSNEEEDDHIIKFDNEAEYMTMVPDISTSSSPDHQRFFGEGSFERPKIQLNVVSNLSNLSLFSFREKRLICNICQDFFFTLAGAVDHWKLGICSNTKLLNFTKHNGQAESDIDSFELHPDILEDKNNGNLDDTDYGNDLDHSQNDNIMEDPSLFVKSEMHTDSEEDDIKYEADIKAELEEYEEQDENPQPHQEENYTYNEQNINYNLHYNSQKDDEDDKSKPFHCIFDGCTYKANFETLIRRHVKHVHEQRRYNCAYCDLKGIGVDGLRKHFHKYHGDRPWRKEDHPRSGPNDVKSKPKLGRPPRTPKKEVPDNCAADDLDSSDWMDSTSYDDSSAFDNTSDIKEEKNVDTKSLRFRCIYEGCPFRASEHAIIKRHVRHVHELTKYNCGFCDLKGIGMEGLKKHLQKYHEDKPWDKNDHPESAPEDIPNHSLWRRKTPKKDESLDESVQDQGLEDGSLYCCSYANCDYSSKFRTLLKRHTEHVHELIRYNCAFCDLKGIGLDGLRKHVYKYHHDKMWNKSDHQLCDLKELENQKFANFNVPGEPEVGDYHQDDYDDNNDSDKDEVNPETGVKTEEGNPVRPKLVMDGEVNIYRCTHPGCSYTAKFQTLVRRHVMHVHELIRYNCAFCDLTGIGIDGLRKHVKKNHEDQGWNKDDHKQSDISEIPEEKTFTCGIDDCEVTAPNRWSLKLHKKTVHGISSFGKIGSKQFYKDGEYYVCQVCDYRSKLIGTTRIHVERLHGVKSCFHCDFKINDIDKLKDHVRSEHNGQESKCNYCSKTFVSQEGLKKHERLVHEEHINPNAELLYCDKCTFRAYGKFRLRRHVKNVHTSKEIKCQFCEKAFNTLEGLMKHDRLIHEEEGNPEAELLSCDKCNYKGYGEYRLRRHQQNIHRRHENVHYCDKCDYKTPQKTSLQRHINAIHLGIKNKKKIEKCKLCPYQCHGKKTLQAHSESVHGEKLELFYCDQCTFSSIYKTSLDNHKRLKHGEKVLTTLAKPKIHYCEYCEFSCKTKPALTAHINSKHLGIRYNCDICDYSCSSPQMLTWHTQGKHGGGYPCQYCQYKATQPGQLTLHIKAIHEGTKFYCNQCQFSSSFKTNLNAHIRKCH